MIQLIHFKMIESGSRRKSFPTGHKNMNPEIKIPLFFFRSFAFFPKKKRVMFGVSSDGWFVSRMRYSTLQSTNLRCLLVTFSHG